VSVTVASWPASIPASCPLDPTADWFELAAEDPDRVDEAVIEAEPALELEPSPASGLRSVRLPVSRIAVQLATTLPTATHPTTTATFVRIRTSLPP
jgi:hypothetical protein